AEARVALTPVKRPQWPRSRSVSAPSSVTNTSPCWNGDIVPGSMLMYGSNFWIATFKPRATRHAPAPEKPADPRRRDALPEGRHHAAGDEDVARARARFRHPKECRRGHGGS